MDLFNRLERSMPLRRETAWKIVEAMLEPQMLKVNGHDYAVPLWYTWYEGGQNTNSEVATQLKKYFARLQACEDDSTCSKTKQEIAKETLLDAKTKNLETSLRSANFDKVLIQFQQGAMAGNDGLADHLGQGFTVFSPSFVEHVLSESDGIASCPDSIDPDQPPPSASQFSPCISEFPRSAVMVKTSWVKVDDAENDGSRMTNAEAMTTAIRDGTWPAPPPISLKPNSSNAYAAETKEEETYVLRSIHFSTKDTREWIWVTLWWSPTPTSDFGQDRPAAIARFNQGVWTNYNMCVTTAFNEGDSHPEASYEKTYPSLAAALRTTYAEIKKQSAPPPFDKVTSWCSNPFLEWHPTNARTNCIGCHQYSHTRNERTKKVTKFNETIDASLSGFDPSQFPQYGRSRKRSNFPAEFAWAFHHEFPGNIKAAKQGPGENP